MQYFWKLVIMQTLQIEITKELPIYILIDRV